MTSPRGTSPSKLFADFSDDSDTKIRYLDFISLYLTVQKHPFPVGTPHEIYIHRLPSVDEFNTQID